MTNANDTRKRLKCTACYAVGFSDQIEEFGEKAWDQPLCNECGQNMIPACKNDRKCDCLHPVRVGLKYCPECGSGMCPDCGSHDVVQISRVTGYLQEVGGWNSGKAQELKDRIRYNVAV